MKYERIVKDNIPCIISIKDTDDGKIEITVFNTPGPQGGQGRELATVTMGRQAFLDMVVKLYPDNVAYQFKDDD